MYHAENCDELLSECHNRQSHGIKLLIGTAKFIMSIFKNTVSDKCVYLAHFMTLVSFDLLLKGVERILYRSDTSL